MYVYITSNTRTSFRDNFSQTPREAAIGESHHDVAEYLRVMEGGERIEAAFNEAAEAYTKAQSDKLAYKKVQDEMVRQAKKKVALEEKLQKQARKETIKLQKNRKKQPATVGDSVPLSFSSLVAGGSPMSRARSASSTSHGSPRSSKSDVKRTSANPDLPTRVLPVVPKVDPQLEAEMRVANFEADSNSDAESLTNFLQSMDLQDFAPLFFRKNLTLESLQASSAAALQELGLPTRARKKICQQLNLR